VTSEDASSTMGMWGLRGGSCAPAEFPRSAALVASYTRQMSLPQLWPLSPAFAGEIPGLTAAHNYNESTCCVSNADMSWPEATSTGVNFRRPYGMLPVYPLHRPSSIAACYESAVFQR
jgi:hypothetical protein